MVKAYAFFRNEFVPLEEARVSITTHALNYGTAVFEGMVGVADQVSRTQYLFRLKDHFERLHASCRMLHIECKYSVEELVGLTTKLTGMNPYRGDVYIRAVAYKSSEGLGVRLHNLEDDLYLFVIPLNETFTKPGISCCISSWRRFDDSAMLPQAKVTGMYVSNALARTQAVRSGFDEAILLNKEGYISEGCGENVFFVSNGRLTTPGIEEGILPGITRSAVMRLAERELGMETEEKRISRGEAYTADECFLTGSLSGVVPVLTVDGIPIGDGRPGFVANRLKELYRLAMTSRLPGYEDWLTKVSSSAA